MSKEDARAKAARLLTQGRVRILEAREDDAELVAEVRGDTARIYIVTHSSEFGWACTCQARGACSHIRALQLVVVVDPRERAA